MLSGNMAANVILGAKSKNLYCYLKHFTLSESGANATDVYCAKRAAKNVIYTWYNTYIYDSSKDEIKINITEVRITPPYPW